MMEPPKLATREEMIDEIISTERECTILRDRLQTRKKRTGHIRKLSLRLGLRWFIGRKLYRSLSELLIVFREDRTGIVGPELARTLDAATGKVIGKKRWITLFSLLAAIPALTSLWLLAEERQIARQQKEDAAFTAKLSRRAGLLSQIYSIVEASREGIEIHPQYPRRVQRDAVLALIELDAKELLAHPTDVFGRPNLVNIDSAPLFSLRFTPRRGEPPVTIGNASFQGTGFQGSVFSRVTVKNCRFSRAELDNAEANSAAFHSCSFLYADLTEFSAKGAIFENCDFTAANLQGANFEGATFSEDCLFHQAVYDEETQWPEEFDPSRAGAIFLRTRRNGPQKPDQSE